MYVELDYKIHYTCIGHCCVNRGDRQEIGCRLYPAFPRRVNTLPGVQTCAAEKVAPRDSQGQGLLPHLEYIIKNRRLVAVIQKDITFSKKITVSV